MHAKKVWLYAILLDEYRARYLQPRCSRTRAFDALSRFDMRASSPQDRSHRQRRWFSLLHAHDASQHQGRAVRHRGREELREHVDFVALTTEQPLE